jgi:hypothetical protein
MGELRAGQLKAVTAEVDISCILVVVSKQHNTCIKRGHLRAGSLAKPSPKHVSSTVSCIIVGGMIERHLRAGCM